MSIGCFKLKWQLGEPIFVCWGILMPGESAFQYLGEANYDSLLDLNSSYHQIKVNWEVQKVHKFCQPYGQFEYNQVPFGIASGSLVLSRLINQIFGPVLYKHAFAYFDDMCVYTSGSLEEHLENLEDTILRIQGAGLTFNLGKTTLASERMRFLQWHYFDPFDFDNEVVQPILKFPAPVEQVQRFIRNVGFSRKMFKGLCPDFPALKFGRGRVLSSYGHLTSSKLSSSLKVHSQAARF